MTRYRRFSPEVRERAVRLVQEHQGEYATQWAAITSIASKIGCAPKTLRLWIRQTARNTGRRPGLTSDDQERLETLERENRELRLANEIGQKDKKRRQLSSSRRRICFTSLPYPTDTLEPQSASYPSTRAYRNHQRPDERSLRSSSSH